LQKLEDITNSIHLVNVRAATQESSYPELYDNLTSSILKFSGFLVLFMIAIGVFATFYFKKAMKDKKYI